MDAAGGNRSYQVHALETLPEQTIIREYTREPATGAHPLIGRAGYIARCRLAADVYRPAAAGCTGTQGFHEQ